VHDKPVDDLTYADIEALVKAGVREGRRLEYKVATPNLREVGKRNEFLYDVSAFANAGGGDIVYGVEESRDDGGKPTGIPTSIPGLVGNLDQIALGMHSSLLSGLDPTIPGLRIRTIDAPEGKLPVMVLRTPQSWMAPHMVRAEGLSRFYVRVDNQKQMLDREGIRRAFVFGEHLRTRFDRRRSERLGRILSGASPAGSNKPPFYVLHVIPLASLDTGPRLEFPETGSFNSGALRCGHPRYNLDGQLFSLGGPSDAYKYTQFFTSGELEALDGCDGGRANALVDAVRIREGTLGWVREALAFYRERAISPPVFFALSILGVKGNRLVLGRHDDFLHHRDRIDREHLILPEVRADTLEVDPAVLMKDAFDDLFRAGGFSRCLWYTPDGKLRAANSSE
jgi:hypothetical protein